MDLTELDQAVQRYLGNCVAPSTRAAYCSAMRRYHNFCNRFKIQNPFPLTESIICRFVAFLDQEGLKHHTLKVYLSGLRFAQIYQALGNPFLKDSMPLLDYVLAGIKQFESRVTTRTDPWLPITIQVLRNLKLVWLSHPSHPDSLMLWAASCVGFFGFLRAGEFTIPSPQSYDSSVHLSLSDLAVDSHTTPSIIRLRIKQSKTDPFRQGVDTWGQGVDTWGQRMQTSVQSKPCYNSWPCAIHHLVLCLYFNRDPTNPGHIGLSSPGCTSKGWYPSLGLQ